MTPNFALLLSVEGIVLLHRVQDGWHRAGHVPLDATDLNAEMTALRDIAGDLAPDNVHTKLVLPNDQIRYLTIETARTSLDDIHAAISAATPLALDEMVVDFDRSGGRTHIAAVAKQTLLEAETFAHEHGFAPVSFAAIADDYTFNGEVFFGPTNYARDTLEIGADVSRDDMPSVETGTVAQIDPDTTAKPPKIEITSVVRVPDPDTAPEAEAEAPADTKDNTDAPVPVFASRNRTASGRVDAAEDTPIARFNRSARRNDIVDKFPTAEADAPAIPQPVTASRSDPDMAKPIATFRAPMRKSKPVPAVPKSDADIALAKGIAKADAKGASGYVGLALTAALVLGMAVVGIWASKQMEGGVAGLLEVDPGLQDDDPNLATAPTVVAPAPDVAPVETAQVPIEEEAEAPPTPIVTAIPGRVLSPADAARIYAATGVWQRAPRLPGIPDPVTVTTPQGVHTFDVVAAVQDIPTPGTPDIVTLDHDLPILTPLNPAPANRPLARDEDGFIRAAANGTVLPTGVWIYGRAPGKRPPLRPTDEPVGLDDASIPTVQEDIVTSLQLTAFTAETDLPPARAFSAPALSQPLPVSRPSADAPQQWLPATTALISAPATAPAEAGPAITDVLAAVPAAPAGSAPQQPETSVTSTEDAVPDQQSPAQTIAALADNPLGTQAPAPREEDLFDAPEGFVEVILGRPAIVPPLRPGTPEIAPETEVADVPTEDEAADATPADVAVFQDPSLSDFRPRGRPADLLPPSAATFEAIPTLAGFRPSLRPDGLAPAPVQDPVEDQADAVIEDPAVANATDISAIVATIAAAAPPSQIVNPTRSAIVASPRPDTRPRNFARVVASAQALQQRQATTAAAASTSAAVAQQPAPTTETAPATAPATGGQTAVTVARAATVDNAIRLRDINLIGVYGKPGARRALVRMPNGRFVKVEVGSRLDGGRVTAIGDSALNFVKRGQTYALQLPAG